ncbi:glycosyltransferase family 4 protein [Aliarcobacter butzleri]|uniref:glycosyltransferase family 4 protein n=1 Tax=Aliarcobacter butzleri TaxID=28197 RepID=UPI003AF9F889
MSKNIWIINEYAGTPYHGMTFRHYYLAKELVKIGYKVTIFTSSFSHYKLKQHLKVKSTFTKENIDSIDFIWIKMPNYKAPKSLGRIRNWFLFALKLFFIPFLKLDKPDFILVSSLPLHPIVSAKYLSNKYKAKLIFEVRDIWPLSAIELGGYSPKNPFIKHLQWLENFAYKEADSVVTVLANAYEHMKTRGLEESKFNYIPNGILIDEMNQIEELDEKIVKQIPKDKFIVGYAGTFGIANALDSFIEAAKISKNYENIAFVLVGDGKEKEKLLKLSEGYSNIYFVDTVKKNQVQSVLKSFDICYIGLKKDPLFKYGVSPNKLFDYMYSEKPILYAIDSGDFKPISEINAGFNIDSENPQAILEGVLELYNMSKEERKKMGKNAKKYVIKNHDYKYLAKKLSKVLN